MSIKKFGLGLAGWVLGLLLFMTAGAMVIRFVIGEPATVKSTIAQSGIYNHFIDSALSEAQKSVNNQKSGNKDSGSDDIPLNDPVIKEPIKKAFSPQVLQTNSESFIDGTYRWLNGSVAQPDFVLDFSASNELFIQEAGDRLDSRLRSLPACTAQQLAAMREVNAFKADCIPRGADIGQLIQQAKLNLRSNKVLLPDQKITADTFKQEGKSQNIFATANGAPKQFQLLKQLPWVLLGLSLLLAALIVFISPSRHDGIRRLGRNLTINGVLILLIGFGLYFAQSALINPETAASNQLARDITLPLLAEFAKASGNIYLIFGGVVTLIGGSLWFAAHKTLAAKQDK